MTRDAQDPRRERLEELLAERALGSLSAEEAWELARHLAEDPLEGSREFSEMDALVARLDLAAAGWSDERGADDEPLPEHLEARILRDASFVLAEHGHHGHESEGREEGALLAAPERFGAASPGAEQADATREKPAPSSTRGLAWAGWIAASLALAVALAGWWPRLGGGEIVDPTTGEAPREVVSAPDDPATPPAETTPPIEREAPAEPRPEQPVVETAPRSAPEPPPVLDATPEAVERPAPGERRELLLAEANDARVASWESTGDVAAAFASGDVVWSPSRQEGYMRFVNLAPNNPLNAQYQLWIFDAERDARFPVDGGVFDIDVHRGEVIVPIREKLPVGRATLFAVTLEQPGGVVVSDRERIVVTAALN